VIFSFVGFESSATLAKESANPKRNIPRSVIGCAAFSGIFFTLMAYFMVLGMGDDAVTLGKSTAPFTDVAARAGLGWAATDRLRRRRHQRVRLHARQRQRSLEIAVLHGQVPVPAPFHGLGARHASHAASRDLGLRIPAAAYAC
jgi:hypothetical protein